MAGCSYACSYSRSFSYHVQDHLQFRVQTRFLFRIIGERVLASRAFNYSVGYGINVKRLAGWWAGRKLGVPSLVNVNYVLCSVKYYSLILDLLYLVLRVVIKGDTVIGNKPRDQTCAT